MRGVFTSSEVFFTRDLTFFYWPHHLWIRSRLLEGTLPLWDPHVGFGQSAIADPIRQTLFPPALLLRLLPPVLGFNLLVALPVLVAALATYLFLRSHVSHAAAALGGIVFALSGPVVSTANSINMSWSVALAPAVFASVHALVARPSVRRMSVLAALFALQALAGESVTFLGTTALAGAYAASGVAAPVAAGRERAKTALRVVGAWFIGLMLAAPQLLPVLRASRLSERGAGVSPDVLSLHPLRLLETVAWPLFGDLMEPVGTFDPWLRGLDGSEPLFASTYLGMGALALALLGALGGEKRWRIFWCAAGAVFLLLALGRFTPVHHAFLASFPPARSFRYPAKHAVFAVFALASLAAVGWDALAAGARTRRLAAAAAGAALAVALAALVGVGVLSAAPARAAGVLAHVAQAAGLVDPAAGASALVRSLGAALPRTAALAAMAGACLWAAPRLPRARWALLAVVALDLIAANAGLNPTLDAGLLGEPPWVAATRASPGDRIYIGGRTSWLFGVPDRDDPGAAAAPPAGVSRGVVGAVYAAMFATFPSPWGLRESASANLSALWPREYTAVMRGLANAGPAERTRFLRRTGVRYFLTPRPPAPEARVLLRLPGFGGTALFEVPQPDPRVSVVDRYAVIPDTNLQIDRLFDGFDPQQVTLKAEPGSPAGVAGAGRDATARIEKDGIAEIAVKVSVPDGGAFHVLRDSYDPDWEAYVDGKRAVSIQADGLFRAVRVASGEHEVRWTYRARAMHAGLGLAAAAALGLLAAHFFLDARVRGK